MTDLLPLDLPADIPPLLEDIYDARDRLIWLKQWITSGAEDRDLLERTVRAAADEAWA